jgi:hypothetical protein
MIFFILSITNFTIIFDLILVILFRHDFLMPYLVIEYLYLFEFFIFIKIMVINLISVLFVHFLISIRSINQS